jgi:hypothetical protein
VRTDVTLLIKEDGMIHEVKAPKDNVGVALELAGAAVPDAHGALNAVILALRPLDTKRRAMVLKMSIALLDAESAE